MKNHISVYLSYLLHPIGIPTFACMILWFTPEAHAIQLPLMAIFRYTLAVFFFSLVIPVAGLLLLLKLRAVDSLQVTDRRQRSWPLLITSISYIAMVYNLRNSAMPPALLLVLYLASFALLAGLLINLFSKISLHALGWGAFAASLTAIDIRLGADFHLHVVASILLGGIAGYARLRQQAHNPSQLYAGYLTGIAVVAAIMSSI